MSLSNTAVNVATITTPSDATPSTSSTTSTVITPSSTTGGSRPRENVGSPTTSSQTQTSVILGTSRPASGDSTVVQVNTPSSSLTSNSSPNDRFNRNQDTALGPNAAVANTNASTTVIINVSSQSGDDDASSGYIIVDNSEGGVGTGAVIGIAAGSVLVVLLVVGIAFWLYRRKKQRANIPSPSYDAAYGIGPVTLPSSHPVVLESYTPSPEMAVQDLNNFDRTVDLGSTANINSTLQLESSTVAILSKKSGESGCSLWEDEAILAARIPMEKVVCKELINEGGHGAVYHGVYRGEYVAIKKLLPEKRKDMRQINTFLSEIKMMSTVEHPHIVRFIGVAWDALSDLCAVSEFMQGGDLFTLLRRFDRVEHRVQGFDADKAKIALHVAQALTYLHSLDPIVLHRDLKSMNVLLSEKWEAKLTDFGVSREWTVDTMTAGVGTRRWMAPEVMMGKRYDTSADIFSFGVVLSELDSHQPPYTTAIAVMTTNSGEKMTETALMEMVATGRVRVEFTSKAPSALVELGHACVSLDPRSRPSAGEVHYQLQKILRRYQKYTL